MPFRISQRPSISASFSKKSLTLLWLSLYTAACHHQPPPALSSGFYAPAETLGTLPMDTIPLPDSLLEALRHPIPQQSSSPAYGLPLHRSTLSPPLSSLLESIRLFKQASPSPFRPSFDALRAYMIPIGKLQKESRPAPPKPIPASPRPLFLRKPSFADNTIFPAISYGAESGMPLTAPVEQVIEDSFGRIWILTHSGILCWAGTYAELYTVEEGLPTQSVSGGAWDTAGRLWVCGAQGVAYLKGKTFWLLPLDKEVQKVFGVVSGPFLYLRVRGSSLTKTPLYGWRDDTLYIWRSSLPVGIYPIRSDSAGVWCSLYEKDHFSIGLIRGDTLWRLEGWTGKASIQHLLWDAAGNLWIAGRQGLWRWRGGKATFLAEGSISTLIEAEAGSVVCIQEGNLRYAQNDTLRDLSIGLSNPALDYAYRRANGEWLFFGREGWVIVMNPKRGFTLPIALLTGQKDWVFALYPTEKGDLWIGLEEQGLVRFSPTEGVEAFRLPEEAPYLPIGEVVSLRRRNGLIWLAWYSTGKRQSTFLHPKNAEVTASPPFQEGWLDILPTPQGWIWQAHPEGIGISTLSDKKPRYRLNLHPTTPFHQDSLGRIWFGAQEGLFCWTGRHLLRWRLPEQSGFILAIASDNKGRVWVGTQSTGLYCYEKGMWRRWTRRQGLIDNLIVQLAPTDSGLWIGTSESVAFLTPERQHLLTLKGGVGLGSVAGANGGIFRFAHTLTETPLLAGLLPAKSWLSGSGGNILCLPPGSHTPQPPPLPYIASIEIGGSPLTSQDSARFWERLQEVPYVLPEGLELPYQRNNLSFTLAHGGSFAGEAGVEYRIFLEGLDETWTSPSSGFRVEYRHLPPGHYTLHVVARYADSDWSPPIKYSFTILKPWWLQWWAFVLYGVVLGLVIWGIVRWRTAILREQARRLAQKVAEATATIREQNLLLQQQNQQLTEQTLLISRQKDEIENKNRSLLESITYARRIQIALIPPEEVFTRHFPQSFIFWRPRDIVSGDIYSLYVDPTDSEALYLLVADCTGHGVPGAFVSLLSLTLLNRTISEYRLSDPSDILSAVSLQLTTLLQPDSSGHVKDGFEGVLGRFRWVRGRLERLEYAAARTPFWLIRNGEIFEQTADPIPVGPPEIVRQSEHHFTTRSLSLQSGDWLYFASDGFPDQLGGEKGRKYGYKAFRELLLRISQLPPLQQKKALEETLENWRGFYPQVDDILIIGLQVS